MHKPNFNKTIKDLTGWMKTTPTEVLDRFHQLDNAYSDGIGEERFVFVPGTLEKRALIVAHADTVFDEPVDIQYYNGIFFSGKPKVGIGADDRAGCAIAWHLRNTGHSLLITHGEEHGQKAANKLMSNDHWRSLINETHVFAIQLDRRGYNDLVFYDRASKDFADFVTKATGFKPKSSYGRTDIKTLCTLLSGVNISVGYFNEHGDEEKLVFDYWLNTLMTVKKLLRRDDLPHFPLPTSYLERFSIPFVSKHTNHSGWGGYDDDYYADYQQRNTGTTKPEYNLTDEDRIICPWCRHNMTIDSFFENMLLCTNCSKDMREC